jgi:hypothetical protein
MMGVLQQSLFNLAALQQSLFNLVALQQRLIFFLDKK